MVYRYPGPHKIHDDFYDYKIVSHDEAERLISRGEWFRMPADAKSAKLAKDAKKKSNPKTKKNTIVRKNRTFISKKIRQEIVDAEGSTREIAFKFNVSRPTVTRIKKQAKDLINELDKKTNSRASI